MRKEKKDASLMECGALKGNPSKTSINMRSLLILALIPITHPFSTFNPLFRLNDARSPFRLSATLEEVKREAPAAASSPPFLNKQQTPTPKEEFLESDESKPDLGDALLECPRTIWDFEGIDTDKIDRNIPSTPCPFEINPPSESMTIEEEKEYFTANRLTIREQLLTHGSLWIRGFNLPKSVKGYRELYEALQMTPCLDPLHSSGLRKFASERDCIYEEVNKEGLRGHYIGLHQESTTKRTAAYAAFVCWQPATDKQEPRGRFLIADGKRVLAR